MKLSEAQRRERDRTSRATANRLAAMAAARIYDAMDAAGISVRDLAVRTGVPTPVLLDALEGERDIDLHDMAAISVALELDWVFCFALTGARNER